ncbi:hypothetical protein DYB37_005446 [Aphanomyces astaci]|uniref:CHCH domain-containing protein n=1 Tax=Aphanomyces astaci TaxID=112090 RepID=A0A397EUX0_APHAT|nr:hypothetical protein DYB34_013638 [Aphanomyces astaci]RHZ01767.1 hypothetical protein DYB31_000667 [Aphanomyces astaci]RHZ08414.1 hypothetical protein DYB26_000277 [Aphanomyces astaci]RHZ17153.1 hypothetical protein DYB37_005446 [Aphanomyces astaci]
MGAHESRIKEDDHTKLNQEQDNDNRQPVVQVRVSADLVKSLKEPQQNAASNTHAATIREAPEGSILAGKSVHNVIGRFKARICIQGSEDAYKRVEAEAKKSTAKPVDLKKQEAEELQRVKQVVDELNQKHYRAPVNDVQCSKEREACLQCYRESGTDVLKCKEVSDAFFRCADAATTVRSFDRHIDIEWHALSCIS